jgi:hypothetical protein
MPPVERTPPQGEQTPTPEKSTPLPEPMTQKRGNFNPAIAAVSTGIAKHVAVNTDFQRPPLPNRRVVLQASNAPATPAVKGFSSAVKTNETQAASSRRQVKSQTMASANVLKSPAPPPKASLAFVTPGDRDNSYEPVAFNTPIRPSRSRSSEFDPVAPPVPNDPFASGVAYMSHSTATSPVNVHNMQASGTTDRKRTSGLFYSQPRKAVASARIATPDAAPQATHINVKGAIIDVNWDEQMVQLIFAGANQPHVGELVKIYHTFLLGSECVGAVEVVKINHGDVLARPLGNLNVAKLSKGDQAFFQIMPANDTSEASQISQGNHFVR